MIEENLFIKRTLRKSEFNCKPKDEEYRIVRMETKYEFLLKDYMCLKSENPEK